jgi:hypothetical protein
MWHSMMCVLTWKPKVTPRNRLLFQLAVSKLPTKETESGSSESLWPTPTTQEIEHPEAKLTKTGRRLSKDGKNSHSLGLADQVKMWATPTTSDRYSAHMKPNEKGVPHDIAKGNLRGEVQMWPTPRATERMGYYEQPSPSMIKGTHGWSLPAAVTDEASEESHRMWPTPNSSPATASQTVEATQRLRASRDRKQGILIEAVVDRMFPTPAARDWKDTGENTDYEALAKKSKLAGAVKSKMYPTPRSSEIMSMTMESALNRIESTGYHSNLEENVALKEQNKMWPTPNASDNRDRGNLSDPAIQRRIAMGKQVGLTMAVKDQPGKGTLNPNWVEWLMGYPQGWTDISDSSENLDRVNRLKALGNSIVPQIVYNIGLAILEEEKRTNVTK